MSKKNIPNKFRTSFKRHAKMKITDIDINDNPDITPAQFAEAVVRKGLKPVSKKSQITLRIDSDVLEWFKQTGKGYHTRINMLLRAYMEQIKAREVKRG